jgi:tRNA (guanine37-N1)-methyltransferase
MRFDIVTIFPEAVEPYLSTSILKRAQAKRRVLFRVHDLRKWGLGKRRTLDDKPYGGGAGMVLAIGPIYRALLALRVASRKPQAAGIRKRTRVILTSAKGRLFTQRDAERYAKQYDRLVILCGHYEGVDERVTKYLADEEVSIGPYVLTGGELPALVIADAVTRLLPGVLGNVSSLRDESHSKQTADSRQQTRAQRRASTASSAACYLLPAILEYPQYTRPADFSPRRDVHWRVPKVLLSGNHAKITEWRERSRSSTTEH